MPRILGFLVATCVLGLALPAQAQRAVLSQLYGQGVHEFFGGNYAAAKESLTEAAANDSRDPRVYYYRALANLRLGDEAAAKSDFDRAAALEYTPAGQQFAVSRALQRIQGRERQTLEKHRAQAKVAAYRAAEQRRQQRYGREQQEDLQDLRDQAVAPASAIDRLPPTVVEPPVEAEAPRPSTTVVGPAEVAPPAVATPAVETPAAPAEEPVESYNLTESIPGIIGRAVRGSGNAATPTAPAPTGAPPAVAPAAEPVEDDLFGEGAPSEPADDEMEAPDDSILDPEPAEAETTAPAEAENESDPFAEPADEVDLLADPTAGKAAPAPQSPDDVSLDEAADLSPTDSTAVDDSADPPAVETPAADASDSLDDAAGPFDEPAAEPAADPLGDAGSGAPAADEAAADDPLAEEPAAEEAGDAALDNAVPDDAALDDAALDDAALDDAAEEPAADPAAETPADGSLDEALEDLPADAPAEEAAPE